MTMTMMTMMTTTMTTVRRNDDDDVSQIFLLRKKYILLVCRRGLPKGVQYITQIVRATWLIICVFRDHQYGLLNFKKTDWCLRGQNYNIKDGVFLSLFIRLYLCEAQKENHLKFKHFKLKSTTSSQNTLPKKTFPRPPTLLTGKEEKKRESLETRMLALMVFPSGAISSSGTVGSTL